MKVKTDTKEKFTVISVEAAQMTANLAAELNLHLNELLKGRTKNVVLSFAGVDVVEEEAAEQLVRTQQKFYEDGASFVVCELKPELEDNLDKMGLLELMNVTPTVSEAGDIVQMEEIERELLDEEE